MQGLVTLIRAYWSTPARDTVSAGRSVGNAANAGGFAVDGSLKSFVGDPANWILVVLPMVLAAANSAWIYTTPGWIDPWVYFGFFQHLGTSSDGAQPMMQCPVHWPSGVKWVPIRDLEILEILENQDVRAG